MRYDELRELQLFIGTGIMEAACRTDVARRCKQSGMHWRVFNASAMCALVARIRTQRKAAFREMWPGVASNSQSPIRNSQSAKLKVALFAGCAQDFVYPEHLVAAVKVLSAAGADPSWPGLMRFPLWVAGRENCPRGRSTSTSRTAP